MKGLIKIASFSFVILLAFLTVVACDSKTPPTSKNSLSTRTAKKKVAAKAYYYNSLAAFSKGNATLKLTDVASLQGKKINLVLLYEADAPWATAFDGGQYDSTYNDNLNGLISSYNLKIVKQFAIDEENEGIVMEPTLGLERPVEVAKELSLVDHVLMVHVKEIPSSDNSVETADR